MARKSSSQITIRLARDVEQAFGRALEAAFLRRDTWLGHVLKGEVGRMDAELGARVNSAAARRFIESQLASTERTNVTLSLEPDAVEAVRVFCDKHGVVRDALFNRLAVMLTLPPRTWAEVTSIPTIAVEAAAGKELPTKDGFIDFDTWLHKEDILDRGALRLSADLLRDPFAFHRAVMDLLKMPALELDEDAADYWATRSLSTVSFVERGPEAGPIRVDYAYLELHLPDELVPGSEAWIASQKRGAELLERLGIGARP